MQAMRNLKYVAGAALVSGILSSAAYGQAGWASECLDPMNMMPYSADFNAQTIATPLMQVHMGVAGTVTYGGTAGPCYVPARTLNAEGRLGFSVGPVGSIQTNFDNNLALTVGAPADPVGDYGFVRISVDDETGAASELFGDGGLRAHFQGASNRYRISAWTGTAVDVSLRADVIGDAVRLQWTITNIDTDPHSIGMFFAAYPGLKTSGGQSDSQGGFQIANSSLQVGSGAPNKFTAEGYIGHTQLPSGKPLRTEHKYLSSQANFPNWVKFQFGQTEAYGMRVDNVPDAGTSDANRADLLIIGNQRGPVAGLIANNALRINVAGDLTGTATQNDILLNETSFIQRFAGEIVAPGANRVITHYVRSTWSVGDYFNPYTLVLDAPKLLSFDTTGQNQVSPNPMRVRVWLDNQYATIDQEVDLSNVNFQINLPTGFTLAPGETQIKNVASILRRQLAFVEWQVVSDGKTFGDLPINVQVSSLPGPTKTITTTVRVAATPKITLPAGPNMVTLPYTFGDASLNSILGLTQGVDYQAFRWDNDLGYTPASSVQRGLGYWIVPANTLTDQVLNQASQPADTPTGGLLVSLKSGWNLIGNPYNYPIPLNQIIAVVEDSPNNSVTWDELVLNGYVSGSLAYFERDNAQANGGSYKFTTGGSQSFMEPHVGYWIYCSTFQPVRIIFPPVFYETLPFSGRSVENEWKQTDRQWRLQLSARTNKSLDSLSYVGVVSDSRKAKSLSMPKPPMAPGGLLELSVEDQFQGKSTRMAQALTDRLARKEWKVSVRSEEAGDVTITWPNLPSVPRNVRLKLTDDVTGEKRDLRAISGYTFNMAAPGTRSFTLSMEPGGSTRPVIGNVLVTRPTRDANAPVTISYALSADALVTVRVLSNTGKEIFTVTRGRSDSAGENSATWMLRDSANRAVAPGTYRIEILAETPSGERVRKIVPVNVIR